VGYVVVGLLIHYMGRKETLDTPAKLGGGVESLVITNQFLYNKSV